MEEKRKSAGFGDPADPKLSRLHEKRGVSSGSLSDLADQGLFLAVGQVVLP
jgi:hypothetical protein